MNFNPILIRLGKNKHGEDFLVGDIHGCYQTLRSQLKQLGFNKKSDRLICVGDIINRGPDSIAMIELLEEPWFFSTMGNHEYLFLKGIRDENSYERMLFLNGGGDWIAKTKSKMWGKWFDLIGKLPLAIELINRQNKVIGITHADFIADDWQDVTRLPEQAQLDCIWSRKHFKSNRAQKVKNVDWLVHGHSIVEKETRINTHIFIDSGAYKGNPLTIIRANELT